MRSSSASGRGGGRSVARGTTSLPGPTRLSPRGARKRSSRPLVRDASAPSSTPGPESGCPWRRGLLNRPRLVGYVGGDGAEGSHGSARGWSTCRTEPSAASAMRSSPPYVVGFIPRSAGVAISSPRCASEAPSASACRSSTSWTSRRRSSNMSCKYAHRRALITGRYKAASQPSDPRSGRGPLTCK